MKHFFSKFYIFLSQTNQNVNQSAYCLLFKTLYRKHLIFSVDTCWGQNEKKLKYTAYNKKLVKFWILQAIWFLARTILLNTLPYFHSFFSPPPPLLNGDLVLHLNKLKKKKLCHKMFCAYTSLDEISQLLLKIQLKLLIFICLLVIHKQQSYPMKFLQYALNAPDIILFLICFFKLKLKINLEVMNKLAEFLECFWKSNSYTFF